MYDEVPLHNDVRCDDVCDVMMCAMYHVVTIDGACHAATTWDSTIHVVCSVTMHWPHTIAPRSYRIYHKLLSYSNLLVCRMLVLLT